MARSAISMFAIAALVALSSCQTQKTAAPQPAPATESTATVPPAPPTPAPVPTPVPAPAPAPPPAPANAATVNAAPATNAPATRPTAKPSSPSATVPPKAAASPPVSPPTAAAPKKQPAPAAPKSTSLDLNSLEQRLKDTRAIGVFTKLSLKNQVDDLLDDLRAFHKGAAKTPQSELRQKYDLLIMKVLSLLQNGDPQLASAIASSREALWGILMDPQKFANI
jgi:outer membrane biosynthesis protein TonB